MRKILAKALVPIGITLFLFIALVGTSATLDQVSSETATPAVISNTTSGDIVSGTTNPANDVTITKVVANDEENAMTFAKTTTVDDTGSDNIRGLASTEIVFGMTNGALPVRGSAKQV